MIIGKKDRGNGDDSMEDDMGYIRAVHHSGDNRLYHRSRLVVDTCDYAPRAGAECRPHHCDVRDDGGVLGVAAHRPELLDRSLKRFFKKLQFYSFLLQFFA
jgi:hypothetical protein